jgi:hypothetical protein
LRRLSDWVNSVRRFQAEVRSGISSHSKLSPGVPHFKGEAV